MKNNSAYFYFKDHFLLKTLKCWI